MPVDEDDEAQHELDDMEEQEREEDMIVVEVVQRSEDMSKAVMSNVPKAGSTTTTTQGSGNDKPAKRVRDQDLLDDVARKLTTEQIVQKRDMRLETLKRRLPGIYELQQREQACSKTWTEGEDAQVPPKPASQPPPTMPPAFQPPPPASQATQPVLQAPQTVSPVPQALRKTTLDVEREDDREKTIWLSS